MKVSVYQIDSAKDKERVRFEGYERTLEWAGKIDPAIYDKVFESDTFSEIPEGKVYDFLETLFQEMNEGFLRQFVRRSMSVSDVIVLDKDAYFVDNFGFKNFPAKGFCEVENNTGPRC